MFPYPLSRLIIWFGQTRPEVPLCASPRLLHALGWISCSPLDSSPPHPIPAMEPIETVKRRRSAERRSVALKTVRVTVVGYLGSPMATTG